ncbi:MAG: helix-turn-helix domain-containing protein [Ruminiclostridium sp.]|nr:helix-turn-helix domain-containing protein [Ruminiclostridium sp.]
MNVSNLKKLRKTAKLTQEQVAEQLNVSRQTVTKWESGESLPDIDNCILLAKLYNVTLDDLVKYAKDNNNSTAPTGKHMFGVLKIDEKNRVIIPDKALEVFGLKKGDKLLLMGDETQGLAMVKLNSFLAATAEIMKVIKETDPDEE